MTSGAISCRKKDRVKICVGARGAKNCVVPQVNIYDVVRIASCSLLIYFL